jgi:hypothetical protein
MALNKPLVSKYTEGSRRCLTRGFCVVVLIQMLLLGGGNGEAGEQPSAMANAVGVFASFNRFMRSLSQ